jgi:hypothetical protein
MNHKEADRVPLDLGGCKVTGMNVGMVYLLRQALGLDAPGSLSPRPPSKTCWQCMKPCGSAATTHSADQGQPPHL